MNVFTGNIDNPVFLLVQYNVASLELDDLISVYIAADEYIRDLMNREIILMQLMSKYGLVGHVSSFNELVILANYNYVGRGCLKYHDHTECALGAIDRGDVALFFFIVNNYPCNGDKVYDWRHICRIAARDNQISVVRYALDQGKNSRLSFTWETVACWAAESGHKDLMLVAIGETMAMYEFIEWDTLAAYAVKGGQLDILKFLIHSGAKDYAYMKSMASIRNRQNILEYLSSIGE